MEVIGKLFRGFINPFLNKLTIIEQKRKDDREKAERAAALKILIIQMRQSVPAWCQCQHISNYYHSNAVATDKQSAIYLVKAISRCD